MRISRTFIFCCVAAVLLVFFIQLHLPRHFSWDDSYNVNSTQPFGTALFDSMVSQALPYGYDFYTDELDGYLKSSLRRDTVIAENLLLIDTRFDISQVTDSLLYYYAMRGGNILIAAAEVRAYRYGATIREDLENQFSIIPDSAKEDGEEAVAMEEDEMPEEIEPDSLHFYFAHGLEHASRYGNYYFDLPTARRLMGLGVVEYRNNLLGDSLYPATSIHMFSSIAPAMFYADTLRRFGFEPLDAVYYSAFTGYAAQNLGVYDSREDSPQGNPLLATTATARIGRGSITVSLAPTYFTNFGTVNRDGRLYILRLLNRVADKSLVRYLPYSQAAGEPTFSMGPTVFSYFLDRPPLAMALRLSFIACLLALFVNARRRQRAIPPVRKEHNVTLHFLRQVALLYRPGDDYASLLEKRFQAFAAKVRGRVGADVADTMPEARSHAARLLAAHTREPYEATHDALRELHFRLAHEAPLSFREFKACTDMMNRMEKLL